MCGWGVDRWMDEWTGGWRVDRWMNGQMGGWGMDGWMDRWVDDREMVDE